MNVAPKRVRIQSGCQYLFTILGSTGAKAARRMLMKLTLGVNFINIFEQFLHQYSCAKKLQSQTASTKIFQHKIIGAKAAQKNVDKIDPRLTSQLEQCGSLRQELPLRVHTV